MLLRPEELIEKTEYCIEGDSDLAFILWREWHEAFKSWEQVNPGFIEQIGEGKNIKGKKMPVCVMGSYIRIDGHLIVVLSGTSQLVDYEAIEVWRKKTFKNAKGSTDYMNFNHCIRALGIEIKKKRKMCDACKAESWR